MKPFDAYDEKARVKVAPPLAVAPLAQEDDMRWNPNDDGINMSCTLKFTKETNASGASGVRIGDARAALRRRLW